MAKRLLATASGIRVYSRHSGDCSHASESAYLKCQCVKWAQYSIAGKQFKVTLKTRSASGAQQAAAELMQRLSSTAETGEVFAKLRPKAVTIEDAVKKWLTFREQSGWGNEKQIQIGNKLIEWCKANGAAFLPELTRSKVLEFRSSLPYRTGNSSSLKIHWAVAGSFFKWAKGAELIAENPVPNTREMPQFRIRFRQPDVRPFSKDDMAAILQACDEIEGWDTERKHRVKTFILTMRWSGMAISDTATLPRERLIGDSIRHRRRKTNEVFYVPLPPSVASALRGLKCSDPDYFFWIRGVKVQKLQPISIAHLYDAELRKVFAQAKVKGHSHMFRHTFITENLAAGMRVDDVADLVGTSAKIIKEVYSHWITERQERLNSVAQESWKSQGMD